MKTMTLAVLSLMTMLAGAAGSGCSTTDDDPDEGRSADTQAVSSASAFVLTVDGDQGAVVMAPGRTDICPLGLCTFAYIGGTALTITPRGTNAVADCVRFGSWIGACTGTAATCHVVINSDLSVTSLWTKIPGCTQQ